MKYIHTVFPGLLLLAVTVLFFHKFFLFGLLPFPGDLLLSEYSPWRYASFFGYNPGSIPNKAQYFDTLLQIYPWRSLALETMMSFRFPLWNPYNFSGSPLLANIQSSVFYPLNIFYFFLPGDIAWSLLVTIQPFLATMCMYLYARSIKLTKIPALFSSVGYGLSLYMTVFLEYNTIGHILALLPLVLFSFERYKATNNKRFLVLFTLSLATSFLAGHLQLSVVSFGFILVYILFRLVSEHMFTVRKISFFLLVMCLSLFIAGMQLIPTAELIGNSARVNQNYQFLIEKLLMQPTQLVMIFIPDIFGNPATRDFLQNETYPTKAAYIGILPFFFAFFAFRLCKKNSLVRFFTFFSVVLVILLVRNPLSEAFYLVQLPLISSSSPSNMWYLFGFCMSLLAGFGLQSILEAKRVFVKELFIFLSLLLVLFGVSYVTLREFFHLKQVVIPIFIFVCGLVIIFSLRFKKLPLPLLGLALVMLTVFDLFYLFQKFNPFSAQDSVYPSLPVISFLQKHTVNERVWGIGNAHIQANLHTQFRLYSPEGYDPLYSKQYGEFIHSSEDGKLLNEFTSTTRSNASLGEVFGDGVLMEHERRLRIIDFLGVKYVIDRFENGNTEKTFPSNRFKLVYEKEGWKVYENLFSLPRAFLVWDTQYLQTNHEFGKTFYSEDFDPYTSVIVDKPVSLKSKELQVGQVRFFRYEPDRIHYQTVADQEAIFVLTDAYYPGWRAFIDGEEVEILRVNHAFRGVLVPKGTHDITFFYYPQSFIFGIYVSIISSMVFTGMMVYIRRK